MKKQTVRLAACAALLTPVLAQAGSVSTPVPEPGVITLFAAGAIAVAIITRYRKK
jgi:hypothetical protein